MDSDYTASDFVNDEYYSEGFRFSCCGKLGDHEGCKVTRHKSEVNIIVPVVVPKAMLPPATAAKLRGKRKAAEEVQKPVKKRSSRK